MFTPLALLLAVIAGELLVVTRPGWRIRRGLAVVVAGLQLAAVVAVAAVFPGWAAAGVALVSLYSLFNLARLTAGRAGETYLRRSAALTVAWLGLVRVALTYVVLISWYVPFLWTPALAVLALVQVLAAGIVAWSTRRQVRAASLPKRLPEISDGQLPTVTIALPVRNEVAQLEACLTSLLASNYPKLEILAFDDHSIDGTSEVIRRFAHDGVRFIGAPKDPLPVQSADGWLARNRAYEALAEAATGEVVVFCGADVRLEPHSLRQLLALLKHRRKQMLVVLPQNRLVRRVHLLQAMRYYWEMAPPRRLVHRPPVLSSLWLIKRQTLKEAGGFAAVRRSITPESHLARYAAAHGDGYSFMCSDNRLGVWSEKSYHAQQQTTLVRRYPQTHRRPEVVLMLTVGQSLLLAASPLLALTGLGMALAGEWAGWCIFAAAAAAFAAQSRSFGLIQQTAFPRIHAWRTYIALLPCILLDIWYLHRSMYIYEFGDVHWKGRDATGPLMHRAPEPR